MSHPKNRHERFLKGYLHGRRRIKYYSVPDDLIKNPGWVENYTRILRQTGKPCSCSMCGNPRRHLGGKTLHERRQDEKYSAEENGI